MIVAMIFVLPRYCPKGLFDGCSVRSEKPRRGYIWVEKQLQNQITFAVGTASE